MTNLPPDWPFRDYSRFVKAAGHDWHVQAFGQGPDLLMLHGAGGSTHSWRGLAPLLAQSHRVTLIDLPGQGFSRSGRSGRAGLDPMAEDIATLCQTLALRPEAIIGHSAGGALALRLCGLLPKAPDAVVCINPALGNFEGLQGVLFPIMARALTFTPFVAQFFAARTGTTAKVRSLITSMGSKLDDAGIEMYRKLVANPAHVRGTLDMMASWRLDGLLARLPHIRVPCLMLTATGDAAVPPAGTQHITPRLPFGQYAELPVGGHLIHEEDPEEVERVIRPFLAQHRPS
jgi:magnesium chelatase accessory protein